MLFFLDFTTNNCWKKIKSQRQLTKHTKKLKRHRIFSFFSQFFILKGYFNQFTCNRRGQFATVSISYQSEANNLIHIKKLNMSSTTTTASKTTPQLKRSANLNKIRQSLQQVPLLHQNVNLVKKKMEQMNSFKTQMNSSRQLSTPESENFAELVENYELFEQKYILLEKLGEGSNGVVHKCKKRQNGEQFAVKTFTFDDEHLPGLKANFLVMKRLKHPNTIKYEALYIDPKKHQGWLVMEYVSLPSLSKANVKSEEEIKNIMFQIIETLSYLHRQDIVHRDIKPENILYDSKKKTVKLIDFGISKRFRRRGALIDMWTITGTLYYRAPEMLTGGYREQVDIWAAGILLYKLVTGKTPFQSEYHHQTIQNIRGAELTFPSEFNYFSTDIRALIARMLSRNVEERPSSSACLKDQWFSSIVSNYSHQKGENKAADMTLKESVESSRTRCRLQAPLSLYMNIEEEDFLRESPLKESVRSYVRKVNGKQYHVIDKEWK